MNRAEDDSEVAVQKRRKEFDEQAPRYLNLLFGIIFNITHDRELADEIGQQAIYKYLSFMEKNKWEVEVENEQAYVVQIAKNLLKDRWEAEDKSEETSIDEQVDDRLLKHLGELIDDTFDVEKNIYFEELLRTLPWETIFGNLTDYQKTLVRLHFYEDLTYEEMAVIVKQDKNVVRYKLDATLATIFKRVTKIYSKKGLFSSDTKRERFYGRTTLKEFLVESETPAPPRYDELNELAGKETPGLRRLVEEEAAARKYVITRYQTLIDRKYEHGLLPSENEELDGLKAALDKMDEPFYDALIKKLRRLVEKRGV